MTQPFDMSAWTAAHPWPIHPDDTTEYLGSHKRKGAVMQAYQRQYAAAVQARHQDLVVALFAHYAPDYPITPAMADQAGAMLTRLWGSSQEPPVPWGKPPADSLAQWLVSQAEYLISYTVAVWTAAKETETL